MLRLLVALAFVSLLWVSACGPTEKALTCKPETCAGCCTAQDRCEEGRKVAACGVGGATCATCSDAEFCRNGGCTTSSGCSSLSQSCTVSEDCCVGLACFSGKCGGGSSCTNAGGACTLSTDCCSNLCTNSICEQGAGCMPQGAACSPCCQLGLTCQAGSCQPGSSGGGGGSSCVPLQGSCGGSSICCGQYTCQSGMCR